MIGRFTNGVDPVLIQLDYALMPGRCPDDPKNAIPKQLFMRGAVWRVQAHSRTAVHKKIGQTADCPPAATKL